VTEVTFTASHPSRRSNVIINCRNIAEENTACAASWVIGALGIEPTL
jgi:hypothetical protein